VPKEAHPAGLGPQTLQTTPRNTASTSAHPFDSSAPTEGRRRGVPKPKTRDLRAQRAGRWRSFAEGQGPDAWASGEFRGADTLVRGESQGRKGMGPHRGRREASAPTPESRAQPPAIQAQAPPHKHNLLPSPSWGGVGGGGLLWYTRDADTLAIR
jgi:hypothetical protein